MGSIRMDYGDMFSCVNESKVPICFAYCTSRDMSIGEGISLQFRDRFGVPSVPHRSSNVIVQRVSKNIVIFHLITRETYWHKQTVQSIREALEEMQMVLSSEKYRKLVCDIHIPCICKDVEWEYVYPMLAEILPNNRIIIHITEQ